MYCKESRVLTEYILFIIIRFALIQLSEMQQLCHLQSFQCAGLSQTCRSHDCTGFRDTSSHVHYEINGCRTLLEHYKDESLFKLPNILTFRPNI